MARSKPHFKTHVSIRTHPKTATLFGDNDLLAAYTRIGLLMVERFASRTDDTVTVHKSEFGWLTGKHRADVALKLLERLADVSPMSFERDGDVARISLPNFARKQGFHPKNVPEPDPSDLRPQTTDHREESGLTEPPVPAHSTLSENQVSKLRNLHPGIYSADEVRAWFAAKAPKMRALGRKNLDRTAVHWFSTVKRKEVDDAVGWMQQQRVIEFRNRAPVRAEPTGSDEQWGELF